MMTAIKVREETKMKTFYLHQRVMDTYTGRIGKICRVFIEGGKLKFKVNFCDYTEEFFADEIREVK